LFATVARATETERFRLSLTIESRRTALEAKAAATVWPASFDEVAADDGVIGIVFREAKEFEPRRAQVCLPAAAFEKLTPKKIDTQDE
jgi:hypothetical protein